MTETARQDPKWEPSWRHGVLVFPSVILLVWGVVVGLLCGCFVLGFRTGVEIVEDFWGYVPRKRDNG